MHYLIKLLVAGGTGKEALENAESYASDLVEYGEFDYHDFNGRWGKSKAYGVKSAAGKKHLEQGMQSTREEFDRAIKTVRFIVENFSDDDIYEENFGTPEQRQAMGAGYMSRYMFEVVAGGGHSCYIYGNHDVWGGRIENEGSLESALNSSEKLWVVPVDFHD